ncbi:MAG TPA: type I 3-dehydroquinate dehydratase [Proteiniclasticum sp.]|nr:type I 3-dehydroquinate dehydratase [Proteiniclasticum sp.]
MKPLKIGNVVLDDSSFAICVTLTPGTIEELKDELKTLGGNEFSLIEWRADHLFFTDRLIETVKSCIELIKESFPSKPLLFTYRRMEEGGQTSLGRKELIMLRKEVIEQNKADIIDFEMYWFRHAQNKEDLNEYSSMMERAKELGIKVLLSWHDFEETPDDENLLSVLLAQEEQGADVAKIAVYARTELDSDRLMGISSKASEVLQIPHIAISMGDIGKRSRYDRKNSKSCMTFAPVHDPAAPGQLSILELQKRLREV